MKEFAVKIISDDAPLPKGSKLHVIDQSIGFFIGTHTSMNGTYTFTVSKEHCEMWDEQKEFPKENEGYGILPVKPPCQTCEHWDGIDMKGKCSLDDPINGSAACFRYDHYTPTVQYHNEIFDMLFNGYQKQTGKYPLFGSNFHPEFVHYIIDQYIMK